MEFARLWPEPATVAIDDEIARLDLPGRAHADRPYTVINFVASLDGRATVDGRSGGLGDDGDKAVFRALRGAVDALLVGTGTLATERYGRVLRDPDARARRRGRGLSGEPLLCTVTRSGWLPLEIPLFDEPEAEVIVFSSAPIDLTGVRARVEVVRLDPGELDFARALEYLHRVRGVRAALCEGGPTVFAALLREGLVDRLFLSLAAKLAGGGDAPAITTGPPLPEPAELVLAGVLEHGGTLFLSYERRAAVR